MHIDINMNVFVHPASADDMAGIKTALATLTQHMEKIMATIEQVAQDVNDETTLIDSVVALIAGLKQQVADALAGTTLPPAVQAKVDAVFATAEANKGKLAAAVTANTPAEPTPAP